MDIYLSVGSYGYINQSERELWWSKLPLELDVRKILSPLCACREQKSVPEYTAIIINLQASILAFYNSNSKPTEGEGNSPLAGANTSQFSDSQKSKRSRDERRRRRRRWRVRREEGRGGGKGWKEQKGDEGV